MLGFIGFIGFIGPITDGRGHREKGLQQHSSWLIDKRVIGLLSHWVIGLIKDCVAQGAQGIAKRSESGIAHGS